MKLRFSIFRYLSTVSYISLLYSFSLSEFKFKFTPCVLCGLDSNALRSALNTCVANQRGCWLDVTQLFIGESEIS